VQTTRARWSMASDASVGRAPVFLLGFPRSGTTLLEKVLAGHPRVATLEEVDVLSDLGPDLLAGPESVRALLALRPEALSSLRATYWARIEAHLGLGAQTAVILDKLPLHTLSLPKIAVLFPQAKILFAVRDPRDVIFSCFRRRFLMNAAMAQFLDLENAAAFYDATQMLAAACLEVLPNPVRLCKHETLVADFEGEVRAVLDFMGLDWSESVKTFATRAATGSRTPSDPQIAKGLNAGGIGQWRRYVSQLTPVLKDLDPWVARFGYPRN